jgi:hypothetical protein
MAEARRKLKRPTVVDGAVNARIIEELCEVRAKFGIPL